MTDLAAFCSALGVDETTARQALAAETDAGRRSTPWYVQIILGGGAWITALIMIGFVAALLNLLFGFDEPDLLSAAIGAAMFLGGLLLQLRAGTGVFVEQFAIALAAAGAVIAAASIGVEFDSVWSAAAAAAAIGAIDLRSGRSAQQQFLLAALAVGLAIGALSDSEVPYRLDMIAALAPIGVWLYLRPPRRDLRPAATVLLLAMPLYGVVADSPFAAADQSGGWLARVIPVAVIIVLAWLRNRAAPAPGAGAALAVVAAAAAAICVLLPPGGSAALIILMLAFVVGHWPLAIVGLLIEAYFVPRFYYDLEMSLLTKSWIMAAVGLALLATYAAVVHRRGSARP
ncbi:MAG: DUF4401 domain-containing protein [Dongiaceae bacterium]